MQRKLVALCALLLLLYTGARGEDGDSISDTVGDFVAAVSTGEGPLVSLYYVNGSSICTDGDIMCAVYSFRMTSLYEVVNGVQTEGSGVGFSDLPWTLSLQHLQNDPICNCEAMTLNVTNDGTGSGGAWDSLAMAVHLPQAVGTTHVLVELIVNDYQWQSPNHLEVARLVVDTTFFANYEDGVSTNAEMYTDDSTTAMVYDGYVTLAPTAEAVELGGHLVVSATLNVTDADIQMLYQSFPDGYELRSEMRLGIDSVTDPALLPYDLDPVVSTSEVDDGQPSGSYTWMNWIIGITLFLLVLVVAVAIVTGLLWMHEPSRRYLQRMMNRHTADEEGGLLT